MPKRTPTASVVTLGCRANQYESGAIACALEKNGFTVVSAEEKTDVCIINTCTVTAESDRKSKQMIRRAVKNAEHVIVTGCFAEVSPEDAAAIPGVDIVISNKVKSKVVEAARALVDSSFPVVPAAERFEDCASLRCAKTERVRAYIKIEDGCDNDCAYCIIPRARGPVRSKPAKLVVEEAETAISKGVKEIILTGIEIARYGSDFKEDYGLIDLVRDVSKVDGLERLSLGSLDPKYLTPEIIRAFSEIGVWTRHFHLSIQSGCSKTLKAMRRKYNAEQLADVAGNIRKIIPDAMISVDAIAGFPGESEEDFNESVALLERIRPLHIHSFPYSPREGTEAAQMPFQIADGEKKRRNRILCDLSKRLNRAILSEYVKEHEALPVSVLCESVEDGVGTGHSEHYVQVRFPCSADDVGKIVKVKALGLTQGAKDIELSGAKADDTEI